MTYPPFEAYTQAHSELIRDGWTPRYASNVTIWDRRFETGDLEVRQQLRPSDYSSTAFSITERNKYLTEALRRMREPLWKRLFNYLFKRYEAPPIDNSFIGHFDFILPRDLTEHQIRALLVLQ